MKIPKQFDLMGRTFKVEVKPNIISNNNSINGQCHPDDAKIEVCRSLEPTLQEQVFCHEMVHAILNAMGETELYVNEKFVDVFASLLHQALTTQQGEWK